MSLHLVPRETATIQHGLQLQVFGTFRKTLVLPIFHSPSLSITASQMALQQVTADSWRDSKACIS